MSDYSTKADIKRELTRLNALLRDKDLFVHLSLVGGSALLMSDMSYATEDMDTIIQLPSEVKDLCDELLIDLNNDACDYAYEYENREFLMDSDIALSNITVEYLDLPDAILTKMAYIENENKVEHLADMLEDEFGVEFPTSKEKVIALFDELGYDIDVDDEKVIEEFVEAYATESF